MTGPAPRLCLGLAQVTAADSLLLEGGRRRVRFTGAAVTSALDPLLPLMDGRRDEAALASASGLSADTVSTVVRLLDEYGLVEYPRPAPGYPRPGPPAPEHVSTYLSRTIDATGGYRSAEELSAVLAASSVVLVGADSVADRLADDLSESGVGTVRRHTDIAVMPELIGAEQRAMVVVFDNPDNPQLLLKAVDAAMVPVLRCARTDGSVQVGPLFFADFTACPDCFWRGWRELRAEEPTVEADHRSHVDPESTGVAGNLLAGLAGVEVLAVLAGVTEPTSVRTLTTVSVSEHSRRQWLVTPYRDCPTCGKHLMVEGEGAQAEVYEWQMERPPRALAWAGQPPRAERQRIMELERNRPDFSLSPRCALPAEESASASRHPLLPALSGVMRRVAGFRAPGSESFARWTASGGNLGSAELYVVADGAVFGLPGTVVRYDDLTDEAVAVHAEPVTVARCVEGTGLSPDGVDAVIVLVAAIGRLANKYGWFAYRLAHLDAGCAAVSLAAVVASHGLSACFATGWPDDLAELLELESGREVVTAVAALRLPRVGA